MVVRTENFRMCSLIVSLVVTYVVLISALVDPITEEMEFALKLIVRIRTVLQTRLFCCIILSNIGTIIIFI